MEPIRKILDKFKPKEEKGFVYTLWDAADTFFFAPAHTTHIGSHIRDGMDLKRTMIHVVLALQVCYAIGTFNIGHQHYLSHGLFTNWYEAVHLKLLYGLLQLLPIFLVVHVVGLGIEILFAAKKGHSVEEGFLVSGALLPLIMPPDIPLWILAIAVAFAVIIAKEAFGGTGMNILNIALTARVFVFFAYPGEISGDTCWVAYDYNFLHQIVGLESHTLGQLGLTAQSLLDVGGWSNLIADGWTGATPLAIAYNEGWEATRATYPIWQMVWGLIPGSIGEMSKVGILFGVGLLLVTKIASWRVMLSMLLGCIFMGILLNLFAVNPLMAVPWYYHLIIGSFLFAMAFMATDPVTAASTATGKLVYGFLIGAIGMIIRVLNPAYPEGWMLAILLLNVFAPLIDYFVLNANIKRRLSRVGQ